MTDDRSLNSYISEKNFQFKNTFLANFTKNYTCILLGQEKRAELGIEEIKMKIQSLQNILT